MKQKQNSMLESLAQNYNFNIERCGKLPTIDYVYPDYLKDGNTEQFRFSSTLRKELSDRAYIVRNDLKNKKVAYTLNEKILQEVGKIAPRLGIAEQLSGKYNTIYHDPLLFVGLNESDFSAYIVKIVADGNGAWFELTPQEKQGIRENLNKKAEEKPYRTLLQRIFGRQKNK